MTTKTRVHELAKELGWESKDLVERLTAEGFDVKSHASTLDENQVAEIKERLLGLKSEVIVEKRVRPSVIRRRKQVVPAEAAAEAAQPEPETFEPEEEPAAPAARAPKGEPSRKVEAPRRVESKEKPARIVRRPEPESPAPPVEERAEAAPPAEAGAPPVESVVAPLVGKALPKPDSAALRARRKEEPARIIRMPEKRVAPTGDAAGVVSRPSPAARPSPGAPDYRRPAPRPGAPTRPGAPMRPGGPPRPGAPRGPVPTTVPPAGEDATRRPAKKKRPGVSEERARQATAAKLRKREVFDRAQIYGDETMRGYRPLKGRRSGKTAATQLKRQRQPEVTVPKAIKRRIKLVDTITVAELAKRMGVKGAEVIKKLIAMGVMVMVNQAIDFDTATLVATEFGYEVEKGAFEEEEILQAEQDKPEEMAPRPPVVTIMGHVDHGKTSLLDAIRETNVIQTEAGGITQHIGAYHVKLDGGDVVFLDTPGHEAFTAMRARGAQVTDVVVLVVAADDGVMEQTVEAINHAKAAQVPIIVAVNKIDKVGANPDRVKKELADHALIPEDWGGETVFAEVSAKKHIGIQELLESILLQAEILELKSNPDKLARGRVIEARLDKGRGPIATVLVQEGTLHAGDALVCGVYSGRVRAIFDDRGRRVDALTPGLPGEVQGLGGVPMAGDDFVVLEDERKARQVAAHRQLKVREKELAATSKVSLEKLYERIRQGQAKELNVVLKADVQGSLEAISEAIAKLPSQEVKVNVIHAAIGALTETDVMLASASDAIVIGFGVRANPKVSALAEQEKVDVRYYDVIYQLIGDIRAAMVGLLEPVYKEKVIGRVEVRETFNVPKVGTVAGCYVSDGKVERAAKVRLLRDGKVVYTGKLASLRRFKDDVKEVAMGYECGLGIENFQDVKVGDVIEAYQLEAIKAELEEAPKAQ